MELSSPETIRALLEAFGNPAQTQPRRGAQDVAELERKHRKARCRCGQCRRCVDDARWERIYAEKFADPSYYTLHNTWRSSPLASI